MIFSVFEGSNGIASIVRRDSPLSLTGLSFPRNGCQGAFPAPTMTFRVYVSATVLNTLKRLLSDIQLMVVCLN